VYLAIIKNFTDYSMSEDSIQRHNAKKIRFKKYPTILLYVISKDIIYNGFLIIRIKN